MPVNLGILSDAALVGLPEEVQGQLQRQATTQFLLGTALAGDPSLGFRSAIGVPSQYFEAQKQALDLAEKAREQAAERAYTERYFPTAVNPVSPEFRGPGTQEQEMQREAFTQARAQGLPTPDVNAAIRDLATLRSSRQPQMLSALQAALPKVGAEGAITAPGAQYLGQIPQFSPQQGIVYGTRTDEQGRIVPFSAPIPGAAETARLMEQQRALGRELATPRQVTGASGAPTFIYPPAPPGQATGAASAMGGERPQTAADIALNKAAEDRFVAFSKQATENAQSAGTRKQSAEFLYNAADQMDPNKATPFFAEAASYLRVIPGVGDKFDSFVGNYNLMNKARAQGILNGFGSVKGNANPQEVRIVENAAMNPTQDPKWNTKWISALEFAAAEKDEARSAFIDSYTGKPGEVNTEWSKSPANIRIYNHPIVERFLREQIQANPTKPALPAGFGLVQNKAGQYGVRKPDGTVMPLGQ